MHEAWLRLGPGRQWRDRAHFFAAAAAAMRQILIDRARQRQTRRHGGGAQRVTFDEINLPTDEAHDDQLLAVNAALEKFAVEDPAKAELVKLRYFVGLTNEEAAQALGISVPTAKRWWAYARVWLLRNIREA